MIGFAGLSHLGIVSSIAAASKGFEVVAFDPDAALCERLRGGDLPVFEPGLPGLLADCRMRIRFTADPAALKSCEVLFFSVDVPTDEENRSDLSVLQQLLDCVFPHLSPGAVLVILSQAPPGFSRRLAGRLGRERLFYQVETLIFGRAVEHALHPERFIVGCADPRGELPPAYAAFLSAFGCPVLRMRYESAELAKISINVCLVASIGAANMLAELCEAVGADWSEIAPALKLDRRIGPHAYLIPGLGIAGGNLERDLVTVKRLAGEAGTDAGVVDAWLVNSRHRRDWALRAIHAEVISRTPEPVVAVWGLAYKADTASVKNSPALALIEALRPFRVQAYDPKTELDGEGWPHVVRASSALEACRGADALAIMTPWPEFSAVDAGRIAGALKGRVIVDPFGVLDRESCLSLGFRRFSLGSPVEAGEGRA